MGFFSISPIGHEHIWGEYKYDGINHWKECEISDCNEISSSGKHSWNEGVVTKEPTYTEQGEKTYTCDICGKTKIEKVDYVYNGGDTWAGADSSGLNGKTKIPTAQGASTTDYTLNHNEDLEVVCTWTGSIPWTGDCRVSGSCPFAVEADINTWDWSAYNTALGQANAWKDAIGATTITWISESDKELREYTLQPDITSNQSLNNGTEEQMPSGGTMGSAIAGSHNDISAGEGTTIPHGGDTPGYAKNGAGTTYTITVKATITPHIICGSCCENS